MNNVKSILKSGMIVVNKGGDKYLVLLNSPYGNILSNLNGGWMSLESYDDELKLKDERDSEYNISRIYEPKFKGCLSKFISEFETEREHYRVIWERVEYKYQLRNKVNIVDTGLTFTTYLEFIKTNYPQYLGQYVYDELPREDETFEIVGRGKCEYSSRIIYVIQNSREQVYLIGEEGIERRK